MNRLICTIALAAAILGGGTHLRGVAPGTPSRAAVMTVDEDGDEGFNPENPPEPGEPISAVNTTLTLSCDPAGAGYLPFTTYQGKSGDEVNVYTYSDSSFEFLGWYQDDTLVSETEDFTYVLEAGNPHLTARFVYNPQSPAEPGEPRLTHTLTLRAYPEEGASLYGSGRYEAGSEMWVEAYAREYHHFVSWTDEEGTVVSDEAEFRYTMPDRDVTLTAHLIYDYDPGNPDEPGAPDIPGDETVTRTPRIGMYDDTHVMMMCETPGAVIHYTLDESDPDDTSAVYDGPVYVDGNLTVKARAYAEGREPSAVADYTVSTYRVAAPVFGFENYMITITCPDEEAVIHYTTGLAAPDVSSPVYTAPLAPVEGGIYQAIAMIPGQIDSEVTRYAFLRSNYTVAMPTFTVSAEGEVTILTVPGAEARYTTDGSDPTEDSAVYTGPFTVGESCTVKAVASAEGLYDSNVGVCEIDLAVPALETPTATFEMPILALEHADPDVTILYSLDSDNPGRDGTLYHRGRPLRLDPRDQTVWFVARRDGRRDSPVGSFTLRMADYRVAMPTAGFKARHIELSCTDPEASIFYTTDGTDPAVDTATLYTAPFLPGGDCTVRMIARRGGYLDSTEGEYVYREAEHTLPAPVIAEEDGRIVMTCTTPEAEIRYTIDAGDPTEASEVYTSPLTSEANHTYRARAYSENLLPSEVTTLAVTHFAVLKPTASYAAHAITLECETPDASIYYTANGGGEQLYEAPIEVDADCDLTFVGRCEGHEDSETATYTFRIADYTLPAPIVTEHRREGWLEIQLSEGAPEGALVVSKLDHLQSMGHWEENAPSPYHSFYIDIEDYDGNYITGLSTLTYSDDPDLYDSEIVNVPIEYYNPPYCSHDGYQLTIEARDTRAAEIELDGITDLASISYDWPWLFHIQVRTVGDEAYASHMVEFQNDAYYNAYTGTAGCREPSDLAKAFLFMGDYGVSMIERLQIETPVSQMSLDYVKSHLTELRHLDLDATGLTAIPEGFLSGLPYLETLALPRTLTEGTDVLEGCRRLTTLYWKADNDPVPIGVLESAENPNMLVWVNDPAQTGGRTHNVVETPAATARQVVIEDGYPFGTEKEFTALEARFTRTFSQTTPAPGSGHGYGWETIALPFDVERIEHEEKGELVPFSLFDGNYDGTGAKPFWLFEADEALTWRPAEGIRAGVPYIISMPNHEEYAPDYRLKGTVVFSGTDVTITKAGSTTKRVSFPEKRYFCSLFSNIDGPTPEKWLCVNVGRDDYYDDKGNPLAPGSAFVSGITPRPMHAYMTGEDSYLPSYLPIFNDKSEVGGMLAEELILVEAIPCGLRLTSGRDQRVTVFASTGIGVATADLRAGDATEITNLVPGIYIVAGHKVAVH